MAQQVQVILVDDIDGGGADFTVAFSFDGVSYEIDLSDRNSKKFADVLALYVGHARRVGSANRRAQGRRGAVNKGASPAVIREWATAGGYEVSERGRISAELRSLYDAAHA